MRSSSSGGSGSSLQTRAEPDADTQQPDFYRVAALESCALGCLQPGHTHSFPKFQRPTPAEQPGRPGYGDVYERNTRKPHSGTGQRRLESTRFLRSSNKICPDPAPVDDLILQEENRMPIDPVAEQLAAYNVRDLERYRSPTPQLGPQTGFVRRCPSANFRTARGLPTVASPG